MKYGLTDCIINHIFDNLGLTLITPVSIQNKFYSLNENIKIINDNGDAELICLWGTQVIIDNLKFKLIVADFTDKDSEFALIVKLENCPTYACYLAIDAATGDPYDGLIAFSLKENSWLPTNISIQATFLAGMENLKDITGTWNKLDKYHDLIEGLKSFIEYHDSVSLNYREYE